MLLDKDTSEQAFHRLLSNKSSDYHAKLKVTLEAAANVKKLNAREADGKEEKVSEEDDDPQLIGEAKTDMTDVVSMNISSLDRLTLEERVSMLNDDQRRVFDNVKTHLVHQKSHEQNECSCNIKSRLTLFIKRVMSRMNVPVILSQDSPCSSKES